MLAGFAPAENNNQIACQATDAQTGDHLEVTTKVFRTDDRFQLVSDVHLVGRWQGKDIDRTFSASKFLMDRQIDKDSQFRLSLHSRPIEDDRFKWFFREAPLTDGFDFTLPATIGKPKAEGHVMGLLPDRPPPASSVTASCVATPVDR